MKITEIAFVVYAAPDLRTLRPFYEEVLGLIPSKTYLFSPDGSLGMVEYDIGAGTLAIGAGAPMFAAGATGAVAALEVDDFPAAISRLKESGAKFVAEPAEHRPCFMAAVSDPAGNTVVIHKRKPAPSA